MFMFMILIGLLGLFLISYFGEAERGGGGGASAIKGYEYLETVAN